MIKRKSLSRLLFFTVALVILVAGVFGLQFAYHRYLCAAYPLQYQAEVEQAAIDCGLSPYLIYAVIHTESDFDPDALSPAGAKGLMQLTDDTYKWAVQRENKGADTNPQNLFDPSTNIHYGAYVLALLGEQFEDPVTRLAAYNAGQGHVAEWLTDPRYSPDGKTLKDIPFKETRDYVRRVQQAQNYYRRLYQ